MGWSNWSGSVTAPAEVARPQSEDELAALVRRAGKVRATGAGHSFMPLCQSDELILGLDRLALLLATVVGASAVAYAVSLGNLVLNLVEQGWANLLA